MKALCELTSIKIDDLGSCCCWSLQYVDVRLYSLCTNHFSQEHNELDETPPEQNYCTGMLDFLADCCHN